VRLEQRPDRERGMLAELGDQLARLLGMGQCLGRLLACV
jgi:hypothetical protein